MVVMKFREMQKSGALTPEHKVFITNNQDMPLPDILRPIIAPYGAPWAL